MPPSKSMIRIICLCACLWMWQAVAVLAQAPAFSYQGQLSNNGTPANGAFDLRFIMYDMLIGGAQQGPIVTLEDVIVTNGNFTVTLDFGAAVFPGAARFLEIAVRPGASTGAFTVLTPRQPIGTTPYAIRSLSAASADTATNATNAATAVNFSGALAGDVTGTQGATQLANNAVTTAKLADGSVTNAKIVSLDGSKLTGTITTASVPGANVMGTVANAATATNATTANNFSGALGGDVTGNQGATTVGRLRNIPLPTPAQSDDGRVLRYQNDGVNPPSFVLAADANSGGTITGVTVSTGLSGGGTSGVVNIAIGAGGVSTVQLADQGVTTAKLADGNVTDAKIATVAGNKITGTIPVAAVPVGSSSYIQNTTTTQASTNFNISGDGTAGGTLTGDVVRAAMQYNIGAVRILSHPGIENLFVGRFAGQSNSNVTGQSNTFVGSSAGSSNISGYRNSFFGAEAGIRTTTGAENSFFGMDAGYFNLTGDGNSIFGKSAGFSNSEGSYNSFFGRLAGSDNTSGSYNAFFGSQAGDMNTTANNNSFFGFNSGSATTTGGNNSFFGRGAGTSNITGTNNTLIGYNAEVGFENMDHATAIGADAIVTSSARIQLGRDGVDTVRIGALSAATATHVCISSNNVLASCSSSRRYKQNIQPLRSGLNLLQRLRPVRFDWKEQRATDLGLIAEEVAKVEPLLVTHNKSGVIEGVKYDQLAVVLINAVKEQQAQITALQRQVKVLQQRVRRAPRQRQRR